MSALDKSISNLPAAPGGVDGTTLIPGVWSGTTYKVTISQITSIVQSGLTLGTAATYNVGQGGVAVPLLSNQNVWGDVQTVTNGVKIRSSPSAGNPEAYIYTHSDGTVFIETNLQNPGFEQYFSLNPSGTLTVPGGFTFPSGLTIANGGTGATTASGAIANLGGLQKVNNLSDVSNATTARNNLGLGTAAVQNSTAFAQVTNNLSDVNASSARTNLGLGTTATTNTGTSGGTVPLLNGANSWSATQTFATISATSLTVGGATVATQAFAIAAAVAL